MSQATWIDPQSSSKPAARGPWLQWLLLVAAFLPAGWVFIWAGAGGDKPVDQRATGLWQWPEKGGFAFLPGLPWIWIASGLLFILLCFMMHLLERPQDMRRRLRPWVGAGLVLGGALWLRVQLIAHWSPSLGTGLMMDAWRFSDAYRWGLMACDLAASLLLLLHLRLRGQSVWWAALYAWHPLVLIETAGNGHFEPAGVLFLVAAIVAADHLRGVARWAVAAPMGVLAAGVLAASLAPDLLPACSGMHLLHARFNSLTAELLGLASGEPAILWIYPLLGAAGVIVLGLWRRWPAGQTAGHLLVVLLLFWPRVYPWYAIWPLAAGVLAFNRAAWVMSATILGAYAVHLGTARTGQLPYWLLLLEWLPVAVVEGMQLLKESQGLPSSSSSASASPAAFPS